MNELVLLEPTPIEMEYPDISQLVTEDDEPVDNLFSEKQQRLLTETLYTSWQGGSHRRSFLAAANVGLFYSVNAAPLVPDVFLSMDVQVADNWYEKRHRSYLFWEFGKAPEVVVELVSNQVGEEMGRKLTKYAQMGIDHYIVFDPTSQLSRRPLRVFERRWQQYQEVKTAWFAGLELGMMVWSGEYEGKTAVWLRWCDEDGQLIPTGYELVAQERQRADQEVQARRLAEAKTLAMETELSRLQAELARLRGENGG